MPGQPLTAEIGGDLNVSRTSEDSGSKQRGLAAGCGATGAAAALICMFTCCLPPVLVALSAGAATGAGMAAMGHPGGESHGTLDVLVGVLHRISPALLIGSVVTISAALALRRRVAAVPALLAGGVLYLAVHAQTDPVVMSAGMAVGYGSWIGLYLWTRSGKAGRGRAVSAQCG